MEKKDLIELTNKVYKQTLLFPKKEPLRYRVREAADDLLEKFIEWDVLQGSNPGEFFSKTGIRKKDLIFEIEKNLELIKGYFNIVKWQNWVSYFDIIKIKEEYEAIEPFIKLENKKIKDSLNKEVKPSQGISSSKKNNPRIIKKTIAKETNTLDLRKKKILETLEDKKNIQVKEIKEIMPDVSKRTIRRDFDFLLKRGFVKRVGESNSTYYELVRNI